MAAAAHDHAAPAASGAVRRRCACESARGGGCGCGTALRRRARSTGPDTVPAVVHDVLRSPGRPLDAPTRATMERRLGHDFGRVRVHADARAAASAAAVSASAYTVGDHVVLGEGGADPGLLAHELAHVALHGGAGDAAPVRMSAPGDADERAADVLAETGRRPAGAVGDRTTLRRRLVVDQPGRRVPLPAGGTAPETNAEIVEGYLRQMSAGGSPRVDRGSGVVSLSTGFCPGFLGGVAGGARAAFNAVNDAIGIPVLGHVAGAIAGFFGGIVGGIRGAFSSTFSGRDDWSPAAQTSTRTGSTCLCDFVHGSNTWRIRIDDSAATPNTVTGVVTVWSPYAPQAAGAANAGGGLRVLPPWLVLAHELCGHAWLEEAGRDETDGTPELVRDSGRLGAFERLDGDPVLRHGRTVQRENLIRAEHGLPARGFRVRDPFCGESFFRPQTATGAPTPTSVNWQADTAFGTKLTLCEVVREQRFRRPDGTPFRIDERIPDSVPERSPVPSTVP